MSDMTETERPVDATVETGPAAAVILASGIGALVLGICTTLAAASTDIADWLQWNDRVGPLSGKTILAVAAFFVAWAGLHVAWRRSSPPLRTTVLASVVLLAAALLLTFPTFFQAFE